MTLIHILAALGIIAASSTYVILKTSGAEAAVIYLIYAVAVCASLTASILLRFP